MTYLTPGEPKKRVKYFRWLVIGLTALFAFRLVDLQVIQAESINKISYENRAVSRTIPALRGDIVDSTGEILARTVYRYDINAAPSKVMPVSRKVNGQSVMIPVEQVATELATILEMTPAEVMAKIIGTGEYAQIKKRVDAEGYRKIRSLNIPWIYYDPIPSRLYPNGAVAGSLLGYLNSEGVPVEGIETTFNSCLAGVDGQETFEKGVDGIKIPSSTITTQAAVNGRTVHLTINADLQYFAQQVLTSEVARLRADWAVATVVEVKTGKILAAAEAPSVDPNKPGDVDSVDRGSRVFRFMFEPGSTLKTITAATAIDQGKATPTTRVVAPFAWTVPGTNGYKVTDSHAHGDDKLTLAGVLRDSSNTGIMKIGQAVDYKTRYTYLKKFGLGQKTNAGYPGEEAGLLNNVDQWDGIKKYVSMFGQGVSITPIQSAMMYQTIANKGVRLLPQLVEGCDDANGNLQSLEAKAPIRVVSEATAKATLDAIEKVVEQGGIGKTAQVPGYRVAGKTGTAQIAKGAGGYSGRYAVSFIGTAPVENPQFVVAVTVYKPRTVSNSIGATPSFKRIMQQLLRTYRVPPSTTKSANIPTEWK
jgi:cell division protein FtsI (penicillin-binding protein 3)